MKLSHFQTFAPVCPVCRTQRGSDNALVIANVFDGDDQVIQHGMLHCSEASCQHEYPIIDGIPIIVESLRTYLPQQLADLLYRTDLPADTLSLIGDCCGPGSEFDAKRQQLSTYCWDHYGDLLPVDLREPPHSAFVSQTDQECSGSMTRVLHVALDRCSETTASGADLGPGPLLDVGCSVGRAAFELAARYQQPVLGIDINLGMLRIAAKILRDGLVRYDRRRVGVVYDRIEHELNFSAAEFVDFWACDAQALPFAENSVAGICGMNILDSIHSPTQLLGEISRVLQPNSSVVLSCPYDWTPSATTVEQWIGGHSQRSVEGGAAEPMLRRLLSGTEPSIPLKLIDEQNLPWHLRLHSRSRVTYDCHVTLSQKLAERQPAPTVQ